MFKMNYLIDQSYYKEGQTYFLFEDDGITFHPVVCEMVSQHQAVFVYIEAATPKEFVLDANEYKTNEDMKRKVSKYPVPNHY